MKHKNISVILVEPQGPINIGSVCRAMMNFGFSDLRLVTPCKDYLSENALKMALKAQPILKNAKLYNNLKSALADFHIAFGTTRRFGKYRNNFFTPETSSKKIADIKDTYKCALVLGRENNGLHTSELELCQHFITIPTNNNFPSMNLSHALTVLLYQISKALKKKHAIEKISEKKLTGINVETETRANIKELEQMYSHMKKTLCEIDFLDPQNPDHILRTFRKIFGRTKLYNRDVRIIRGLMSHIAWIDKQKKI